MFDEIFNFLDNEYTALEDEVIKETKDEDQESYDENIFDED